MDLILILLQSNKPPAADAHYEESKEASKHHPRDEGTRSASSQSNKYSTPRSRYQHDREGEMALPRAGSEFATKDWEEAKNFDREECQREHMCGRRQARSKDSGSHHGRIGGDRCGKSVVMLACILNLSTHMSY